MPLALLKACIIYTLYVHILKGPAQAGASDPPTSPGAPLEVGPIKLAETGNMTAGDAPLNSLQPLNSCRSSPYGHLAAFENTSTTRALTHLPHAASGCMHAAQLVAKPVLGPRETSHTEPASAVLPGANSTKDSNRARASISLQADQHDVASL